LASGLERLKREPRCSEAAVPQPDRSQRPVGIERVLQRDRPTPTQPVWRRPEREHARLTRLNQRGGRPAMPADPFDRTIDRVTLADAPQIEHDSRTGERDGAMGPIEPD